MPKSTTYIYICTYVHAYTETIRDGGYWCEKGVQSQEDVNIPVLFRSMQIVRGMYVIKQCEYQCLI